MSSRSTSVVLATELEKFDLPLPMTVNQLEDYQPHPEFYILGNGLLRQGALTLLISYTGWGKSVLALQLALSIASGKEIFGMKPKAPCNVFYIQSENDEDTLKRDVMSISEHCKLPRKLIESNFFITPPFLAADSNFEAAFDIYTELYKPRMVVVDHYQSYTDGDLNSTPTFKKWITPINVIMRERGIGMLLVVHEGKPSKEKQAYERRQGVYKSMGSSIQANWTRTAMLLEATEQAGIYRLEFNKGFERTGLADDNGMPLEHIYIRDSRDPNKPWWERCEGNFSPVKVSSKELVEKGVQDYPGLSRRALASRLRLSKKTIDRYYPSKNGKKDE